MRTRPTIHKLLLIGLLATAVSTSAETKPEAQIDFTQSPLTIAFLGDSITHAGEFHQWVQLFLLTRYPGQDTWTFNGGYAGENTRGVLSKDYLKLDIFPQDPDVILVHLGMNDFDLLSYSGVMEEPSDESRAKKREGYRKNLTEIINQARAYGAKVGIISPTIYDDTHKNNKHFGGRPHANAELGRFSEIAREVAASFDDVFFIDVYTPMDQMTRERQEIDPKFSIVRDRVHPSDGGNEVMAFEIIKGLDARPLIYDLKLDAAAAVIGSEGAEVHEPKVTAEGLQFKTTETALPFPTAAVSDGFGLVPFDATLNRMRLTIADLPAGEYALVIDGTRVATHPARDWAGGVDLSTNTQTPQYQQAQTLAEQVKVQKLPLQRAVADMRSLRFQLLFKKEPENEGLVWEWDKVEPEKVVDAANRLYDRLVSEDKKPGGWGSYVFKNGREAWANYDQIQRDLAELRAAWAAGPAEFRHEYRVFRVDPSQE